LSLSCSKETSASNHFFALIRTHISHRYICYLIVFDPNIIINYHQISILTRQFLHSKIIALALFDTTENFLDPQFLQTGQALSPFVIEFL